MFGHVSVWGILLAALSAMVVGALWYSPVVFGKEWSRITGITQKNMSKKRNSAMLLLIVVSLVTAYALSLFIIYLHTFTGNSWLLTGVQASLLAGIGFGATTVFAYGAFESRDKKILYINAGNRIVTLFIMGLIIAAFLN